MSGMSGAGRRDVTFQAAPRRGLQMEHQLQVQMSKSGDFFRPLQLCPSRGSNRLVLVHRGDRLAPGKRDVGLSGYPSLLLPSHRAF